MRLFKRIGKFLRDIQTRDRIDYKIIQLRREIITLGKSKRSWQEYNECEEPVGFINNLISDRVRFISKLESKIEK